MMKNIIILLVSLFIALVLTNCKPDVSISVSKVRLNKNEISLAVHSTDILTATIFPITATDKTIKWISDNPQIATVDQQGKITAISEGRTEITARTQSAVATCAVKVTGESTRGETKVTSVELDKLTLDLLIGGEGELSATVLPDNATKKTVSWTSSNPEVATVVNGVVAAVSAGETVITATAGEKSASCTVIVSLSETDITSVTLDHHSIVLNQGELQTLTCSVLPTDATDKTVTWSSSNQAVATVENGVITAVGAGTATIIARAGGKSAACQVEVKIPIETLTLTPTSIALNANQQTTLTATIYPLNATNQDLVWTSSDLAVATVENGVITASGAGTTTITATADGKSATCRVDVTVAVESVTLNPTSIALHTGEQRTLTATISPLNATNQDLVWTSSDERVATFNNGTVTAIGSGTATITATCGTKTATCSITVDPTIYLTGYQNGQILVWKNDVLLYRLTDPSRAAMSYAMAVSGNDCYVAGIELINNKSVAKVWKNDRELYTLSNVNYNASALTIAIKGGDCYVGGYEMNNLGFAISRVWKNGVVLYTPSNGLYATAAVNSLAFIGNDLYYATYYYNGTNYRDNVWKNGSSLITLNTAQQDISYKVFLGINGNDYYVASSMSNGTYREGRIWLNETLNQTLSDGTNNVTACSFSVSGGNCYFLGTETISYRNIGRVWKNGTVAYSLESGSGNINVKSISSHKDDSYVAGHMGTTAVLWKNGVSQFQFAECEFDVVYVN